jgi:4-aminobutyrate aminotransferase
MYNALDRGHSFKTSMGHTLPLTPPLAVTQAEMELALDWLDRALRDALAATGAHA